MANSGGTSLKFEELRIPSGSNNQTPPTRWFSNLYPVTSADYYTLGKYGAEDMSIRNIVEEYSNSADAYSVDFGASDVSMTDIMVEYLDNSELAHSYGAESMQFPNVLVEYSDLETLTESFGASDIIINKVVIMYDTAKTENVKTEFGAEHIIMEIV